MYARDEGGTFNYGVRMLADAFEEIHVGCHWETSGVFSEAFVQISSNKRANRVSADVRKHAMKPTIAVMTVGCLSVDVDSCRNDVSSRLDGMGTEVCYGFRKKAVVRSHHEIVVRLAHADTLVYCVIDSKVWLGNH